VTLLSTDEYLARVAEQIPASAEAEYRLDRIRSCLPSSKAMDRLRETLEGFLFEASSGHAGIVQIYDLRGVPAALNRKHFDVKNWHYDRTAAALLINLSRGVHESLSAALYIAYSADCDLYLDQSLAAEKFIDEGFGWFRSTSSYGRALKGKDVQLTAQERHAFSGVSFFE
jgi:hypothetical protein